MEKIKFFRHSRDFFRHSRAGGNLHSWIPAFAGMTIFGILIACLIFIAGCDKTNNSTNNIIFFYSKECPHCKKIEEFFNTGHIRNKVTFTEKEISQNKNNLILLIKIQKRCRISIGNYVEVPLLWTGEKCLTGDQDIIKFFTEKIRK
jgi:glutaredoxin